MKQSITVTIKGAKAKPKGGKGGKVVGRGGRVKVAKR